MQVLVNIDDELMRKALQASDLPTASAIIEEGLRIIICLGEWPKLADILGLDPLDIDPPRFH